MGLKSFEKRFDGKKYLMCKNQNCMILQVLLKTRNIHPRINDLKLNFCINRYCTVLYIHILVLVLLNVLNGKLNLLNYLFVATDSMQGSQITFWLNFIFYHLDDVILL